MLARGKTFQDAYAGGDFVPLLRKKPIIVNTDFDGTLVEGHGAPTARALEDCDGIEKIEKEQELTTANITARPLSFTMDKTSYNTSVEMGFDQPPPKWFQHPDGRFLSCRETGDWCQDPFFRGCFNHHVTASLGGGIAVKHGKGYLIDRDYENCLNYDHVQDAALAKVRLSLPEAGAYEMGAYEIGLGPMQWRVALFEFLFEHFPAAFDFMTEIESLENYHEGRANAAPQMGRVKLTGRGTKAFDTFTKLLAVISEQRHAGNRLACRIAHTSEDKVDPANSEKTVYTLYLTPKLGLKKELFNWQLMHMAEAAGWSMRDLLVFYAGDTVTDLLTALWGGRNARVTALIVTHSRITQAFLERWKYYGLQYLGNLWANPARGRTEDRLQATNHKGVFRVYHKVRQECNYLVLGDLRYPNETAPGSVRYFLEEFVPKTPHWGSHPGSLVIEP